MDDLKVIIAANITQLRKENNLTQAELAEKLNYSDKAVSKWERGESLPDITILKTVADMFGVTVDYLLTSDHQQQKQDVIKVNHRKFRNRSIITCISVMLVWFIATLVFFILEVANVRACWLSFIYAVPTSLIVWLVFNSIWFIRRRNFLIISLLMWTTLASLFITLIGFKLGIIFIVGVPAQIIILLWSGIKGKKK